MKKPWHWLAQSLPFHFHAILIAALLIAGTILTIAGLVAIGIGIASDDW